MRNRYSLAALVVLAFCSTWIMGASTASAILPHQPAEELNCEVLHGLTPEELEKTMHKLVFSSRSTVTTGTTVIKMDNATVLTGYACGW